MWRRWAMKENTERKEKQRAKQEAIKVKKRKERERLLRHAKELVEAPSHFQLIGRKKSPETRLSSFFKRFKEIDKEQLTANVHDVVAEAAKTIEPNHSLKNIDLGVENSESFDLMAAAALDLRSDNVVDEPILAAFRAANLDSKNPLHWRLLMIALCWSHFPPKRAPGRPSWTDDQYGQLLADAAQIREIVAPRKVPDRKVRAELAKEPKFKARYVNISSDRVRKRLGEARNPEYHGELKGRLYRDLNAALEKHTSEGLPWSDWTEHEAALRNTLIKYHCGQIATERIGKRSAA
jgi:hypothetical protein